MKICPIFGCLDLAVSLYNFPAGVLPTVISVVSLFGVLGIAGPLGERVGIVPVLNFAALVTITAGWLGLLFLPAHQVSGASVFREKAGQGKPGLARAVV